MKVLKSKKTGLYYSGHWIGKTWQKSPMYAKKFFSDRINTYKDFLDSKGFNMEVINVLESEIYFNKSNNYENIAKNNQACKRGV